MLIVHFLILNDGVFENTLFLNPILFKHFHGGSVEVEDSNYKACLRLTILAKVLRSYLADFFLLQERSNAGSEAAT